MSKTERKNLLAHTDSPDCICCPDVCQVCHECDGTGQSRPEQGEPVKCWLCDGRKIVRHGGRKDVPKIYVHRDIE